jgi:hypothetical protein
MVDCNVTRASAKGLPRRHRSAVLPSSYVKESAFQGRTAPQARGKLSKNFRAGLTGARVTREKADRAQPSLESAAKVCARATTRTTLQERASIDTRPKRRRALPGFASEP